MARSVIILILLANLVAAGIVSKLQSTKVQSGLDSLREMVTKLTKVSTQQAEDISALEKSNQEFHIVSFCQFLSAMYLHNY